MRNREAHETKGEKRRRKKASDNAGLKNKRQTSMVFKRLQSEVNILPMLKEVAENWDDF